MRSEGPSYGLVHRAWIPDIFRGGDSMRFAPRFLASCFFAGLLFAFPNQAHSQNQPSRRIAVRAARLFNGKDANLSNAVIEIEGDKIIAVGSGLAISPDT